LEYYKIRNRLKEPITTTINNYQTTDHILYDCDLVKQERDKLKAEILQTENWPISKDTLINKYTNIFNKFVDSIPLANLQSIK